MLENFEHSKGVIGSRTAKNSIIYRDKLSTYIII